LTFGSRGILDSFETSYREFTCSESTSKDPRNRRSSICLSITGLGRVPALYLIDLTGVSFNASFSIPIVVEKTRALRGISNLRSPSEPGSMSLNIAFTLRMNFYTAFLKITSVVSHSGRYSF